MVARLEVTHENIFATMPLVTNQFFDKGRLTGVEEAIATVREMGEK